MIDKFHVGDLVAKIHPSLAVVLKTGLVINSCEDTLMIKWTSFNHNFFMEKEGDIFKELNNRLLLSTVEVSRNDIHPFLILLNSNYSNGQVRRNQKKG